MRARPPVTAHTVAAVKGAGQKHVLGTDQDGRCFRIEIPFRFLGIIFLAAHEKDRRTLSKPTEIAHRLTSNFKIDRISEQVSQPQSNTVTSLLDQSPHRKAVHQAIWPMATL